MGSRRELVVSPEITGIFISGEERGVGGLGSLAEGGWGAPTKKNAVCPIASTPRVISHEA